MHLIAGWWSQLSAFNGITICIFIAITKNAHKNITTFCDITKCSNVALIAFFRGERAASNNSCAILVQPLAVWRANHSPSTHSLVQPSVALTCFITDQHTHTHIHPYADSVHRWQRAVNSQWVKPQYYALFWLSCANLFLHLRFIIVIYFVVALTALLPCAHALFLRHCAVMLSSRISLVALFLILRFYIIFNWLPLCDWCEAYFKASSVMLHSSKIKLSLKIWANCYYLKSSAFILCVHRNRSLFFENFLFSKIHFKNAAQTMHNKIK